LPAVVAGHKVEYDEQLQQYFADILVDGHGSPYTWIRLALVRLQVESVIGAHISATVAAQFAQLLPDRWITASWSPLNSRVIRIAASRTSALDDLNPNLARLEAEATLLVPAENKELNSPSKTLRLFDGQLWREACKTQLNAHSVSNYHSHWLGEVSFTDKKDVLVFVSEYFIPHNRTERILRWEGPVRLAK
jgi:hypothetical protein